MSSNLTTLSHLSLPNHKTAENILEGYGRLSWIQFLTKRLLDLLLVFGTVIFVLPVGIIIALAIKATSPGPVFFKQARMGSRLRLRNGRPCWELRVFEVYKFRSMVQNADPALHKAHIKAFVNNELADHSTDSSRFKLQSDPRITTIGRFIRWASLDELPQLINVVKGEMSLVGPRPIPLYEVAEYEANHFERLAALPGLTGVWQVDGRGRVTFDEMMAMDISYVRRQSPLLDIYLIMRTIPVVLTGRGAR